MDDNDNICKFNSARSDSEYIGVLNFVHEKGAGIMPHFIVHSVFRLHLILGGTGSVETHACRVSLAPGDVFVTFPSSEYKITSTDTLEYVYISFVGLRAYKLLDRIGIKKNAFVKHDMSELTPFWLTALKKATSENIDLLAESVLLFTIGNMSDAAHDETPVSGEKTVLYLKKQTEERFADPDVDLKSLCAEIYYNPKYASAIFKKQMGVCFSEYITSLRINNALRLIEKGYTSVKQIAAESGFHDAPYFTRVFKQYEGITPKEHILAQNTIKFNSSPKK